MTFFHGCEHAVDAAQARYGIALTEMDFAAMVADIVLTVAGDVVAALLLSRARHGREIWLLRIPHGPAVRVVYSPDEVLIVTVLPQVYQLPGGEHGQA